MILRWGGVNGRNGMYCGELDMCFCPTYLFFDNCPLPIHWGHILLMDTSEHPWVVVKGEQRWFIVVRSFKSHQVHVRGCHIRKACIPDVVPKPHIWVDSRSSDYHWHLQIHSRIEITL